MMISRARSLLPNLLVKVRDTKTLLRKQILYCTTKSNERMTTAWQKQYSLTQKTHMLKINFIKEKYGTPNTVVFAILIGKKKTAFTSKTVRK